MRMVENKYPIHRMLFLVGGALVIGLLAQIAASASVGGMCEYAVHVCGYSW